MAYWVMKAVLTPILRFFFRVRVEGLEHVPDDGAAILASNHISFCDSIFLPLVLKRRITFVAKAEYFEDPKTSWFFSAMGQIPIKRGGGPASQRALESASEVLQRGDLFGIYPEGTRSPDGRLYRGRTGVARLAIENEVPVLAVAMIGTREAQPIGQVFPNLFRPITVRISAPMRFDHVSADDRMGLRAATDQIMFEIRRLSGQEYVDTYCKRGPEAAVEPETTPVLSGPPLPDIGEAVPA
jgi:1-acyl-sn-glycerol-3-phosphate acyltransferase